MKIDHIHFYVEDAVQTSDWLIQKMGFQSSSQQISANTHTEIVGTGQVSFWFSSALNRASPVADYLANHPEGVADVAFLVEDLDLILANIDRLDVKVIDDRLRLTGQPHGLQQTLHNRDSPQITIQGWGDYQHTLIADRARKSAVTVSTQNALIDIDHVVLNVAQHQLAAATQWYQELLGLRIQQSFDIQTEYSGLYSKALIDATGQVQFNINEPSTANSQIQTFLDLHGGAGIQHVALRTQNIFQSVTQMRSQGLEFLAIPPTYYHNITHRISAINTTQTGSTNDFPLSKQEWQELEKSAILLDWPDAVTTELLLQIFTQPIFAQPTFFLEFIERRGQAQGFGEGNFFALFQAIEQQQRQQAIN